MEFPFVEEAIDGAKIRRFSADVDTSELVWHRDACNRIIKVIQAVGWYLQMDDELPVPLVQGETYSIEKEKWHRVIRKNAASELVLEITEFK